MGTWWSEKKKQEKRDKEAVREHGVPPCCAGLKGPVDEPVSKRGLSAASGEYRGYAPKKGRALSLSGIQIALRRIRWLSHGILLPEKTLFRRRSSKKQIPFQARRNFNELTEPGPKKGKGCSPFPSGFTLRGAAPEVTIQ